MSILAYCVADSEIDAPPRVGVAGASVLQANAAGLSIFFSEEDFDLQSEERIRESALAFHRVNDAIFRTAGVVPFRFPTLLPNISDLESFVTSNHEIFDASLEATRDRVQMEIWIYERQPESQAVPASGRAYLLEKSALQQELHKQPEIIRARTQACTVEWQQLEQRAVVRCYALVARNDVSVFRQAAEASTTGELKFRVTGPWPATRFMPLERMQPVSALQSEAAKE